MNTNLNNILNKSFGETKFAKLPVGSYVAVVLGMPEYKTSPKKGTPYAEYRIKLFEAMEDVDTDELEEFGSIADKEMPLAFYYGTEGGTRRLQAFLENCGIDTSGSETMQQLMEEAGGKTVIVQIKHTPSQDGMSVYAQIDGTAKYGE